MTYEIIVRPEAALEVEEAYRWYEERGVKGWGLSFCVWLMRVSHPCSETRRVIPSCMSVFVVPSCENFLTRSFIWQMNIRS